MLQLRLSGHAGLPYAATKSHVRLYVHRSVKIGAYIHLPIDPIIISSGSGDTLPQKAHIARGPSGSRRPYSSNRGDSLLMTFRTKEQTHLANVLLHKLRSRHADESAIRVVRHGSRQKRLSGPRRPVQENALGL